MKLAILGFGKVAQQLVSIMEHKKNGFSLQIKAILVKDKICYQTIYPKYADKFTDEFPSILEDDEIETIVELIGGIKPAYEYVKLSLENKKHVVTANRPLIAYHYEELNDLAKKKERVIFYEGSVGCGIPIIQYLSTVEKSDFKRMYALVNSSCNVIFTMAFEKQMQLADAVQYAIEKKFTEPNWRDDVSGIDTAEKMVILFETMEKKAFELKNLSINCEFKFIDQDIQVLKANGFRFKQLGEITREAGTYDVHVGYYLIEAESILGKVLMNQNYINIEFLNDMNIGFHGKGVSPYLTAMAVYQNLIQLIYPMMQCRQVESCQTQIYKIANLTKRNIWIRVNHADAGKIKDKLIDYAITSNAYVKCVYCNENLTYMALWLYDVRYETYQKMERLLTENLYKETFIICRIL